AGLAVYAALCGTFCFPPHAAALPGLPGLGRDPAVPGTGRRRHEPEASPLAARAQSRRRPPRRGPLRAGPRVRCEARRRYDAPGTAAHRDVPETPQRLAARGAARLARRPVLPVGLEPRPVG